MGANVLPECLPPVVLECLTLSGASQQPHLTEMEAEVDTEEPSVVLIATLERQAEFHASTQDEA